MNSIQTALNSPRFNRLMLWFGVAVLAAGALALVVVILGGSGSLVGSLVGSFVVGFLYNFGQAMFPELAYVVLFLPMLLVLVVRPQGLFGRQAV